MVAGAPVGRAQTEPAEERQNIAKVDVRFLGLQNVNEEVVRSNMQLRAGSVFDEGALDRDVRALYRTGLFDLIEIKREEVSAGALNLVVEVTPKFRVLSVSYVGNKELTTSKLRKEAKTRPNSPLDERQIKTDSEKIFEVYQKAGYSQAEVNYTIDRDRATGFGRVAFRIQEGLKTHIQDIVFTGNDNVASRKLRKSMEETRRWWMFSWLTGKGRLQDDKFEEDLDKLRDLYRDLGYLDVEVARNKVAFDYPKPGRLVIRIPVMEGRRYKVGRITFSGNKLFPGRLLGFVLGERPGNWFTPSKLDKDVEALEDFYGRGGYLDTRVHLLRKPNLATGDIDIVYEITESERFNVESVVIEGNDKTKSTVIVRELSLGPGQVFDQVRMKISKARLDNTRYFDDVDVTAEETNIPARRNLKVKVTEARTGNLTFGAGYSSLEGAVAFAEVTQSNFDLFNYRSGFQGAGEKFRIKFQLGSLSTEMVIGFEEPWLFQKQLHFSLDLYRTTSDYTSNYYDILTTGASVALRRPVFGMFDGRLSYNIEQISYRNINYSTPSAILALAQAASKTVSRVGFSLIRDTRDKIINTTRGNRLELISEIAGGPLGADLNFYRLEARGAQFVPIFKFQNQVIAVLARGGVIERYGNTTDAELYYYNYTLGGPQTLRGFEYREVGPKDSAGNIYGGKTYGFVSIEYSADIVDPVRFAIFYDGGFVNRKAYDFNPGSYNDNWGVGIRMSVMGNPLSLDLGIPLTTDKFNKKGSQFNFSFGTRF